MMKTAYVYILASQRNGTLYTGVTTNLIRRVAEHKRRLAEGFATRYNVSKLAYYEIHEDICGAIVREKQIKRWKREWKLELIEAFNPQWADLYDSLLDGTRPADAGSPLDSCFRRNDSKGTE